MVSGQHTYTHTQVPEISTALRVETDKALDKIVCDQLANVFCVSEEQRMGQMQRCVVV